MRPDVQAHHTNIGTATRVVRFGLDQDSTAHLISLLTDLYSDRIGAAVREVLTNALDSHLSAQTNRPVEITSPSSMNDFVFSIEDFGLGLGLEELEGIYSLYGASSKREDDAVGGLLGLGSKAPLTYADDFRVTATQDGRRVFAQVSKDEDGVPALRILGETEIDAPNGVKIDVTVRQTDVSRFTTAIKHYTRFLAPGAVLVDGERPTSLRDEEGVIWLDDEVAIKKEAGYLSSSYIVQHNVPYPIPNSRIDIPGYKVFAFVPTRTVNFTPSREALDFTEKTIDVVDTLAEYIEDRLYQRVLEEFEAATPFGQLQIINDWRGKYPKIAQHAFGANRSRYLDSNRKSRTHLTLDREYWHYDRYDDRASKGNTTIAWMDFLDGKPIIIGYPNKTVTKLNRVRLDVYFGETPNSRHVHLLPGEPTLDRIDGYPGVIVHWDTIVAATPDAKVERTNYGSGKSATEYGVHGPNNSRQYLTIAEIKEAMEEGEITTLVYNTAYGDKQYRPGDANYLPDVHVLSISDRQVGKIKRTFEGIEHSATLRERRLAQAKARLTREDFERIVVLRETPEFFEPFRSAKDVIEQVEDADLWFRLRQSWVEEKSDALKAYEALGGHADVSDEIEEEVSTSLAAIKERYPLFHGGLSGYDFRRMPIDDIVLYLNAKFHTTQSNASSEEAA